MEAACVNCGKKFQIKPHRVKLYPHHFCSMTCLYQFRKKDAEAKRPKCLQCGRPCHKPSSKFCSHSCKLRYQWESGVWKDRVKEPMSPWKKKQSKKTQIIIMCPTLLAVDFSMELKELVNNFNRKYTYTLGTIEVRHGI